MQATFTPPHGQRLRAKHISMFRKERPVPSQIRQTPCHSNPSCFLDLRPVGNTPHLWGAFVAHVSRCRTVPFSRLYRASDGFFSAPASRSLKGSVSGRYPIIPLLRRSVRLFVSFRAVCSVWDAQKSAHPQETFFLRFSPFSRRFPLAFRTLPAKKFFLPASGFPAFLFFHSFLPAGFASAPPKRIIGSRRIQMRPKTAGKEKKREGGTPEMGFLARTLSLLPHPISEMPKRSTHTKKMRPRRPIANLLFRKIRVSRLPLQTPPNLFR